MTPSSQQLSVLLADDHPLFTHGLRQALEASTLFRVVGECRDGQAALDQARQHQPQLAVLDIDMPKLDGFRVIEALVAEKLPTKVVFLTVHNEASFLRRALQLGAQGYLLKDTAPAEIVAGIRAVSENQLYVSPALSGHLVGRPASASAVVHPASEVAEELALLTPAERQVLALIGECRTTKEIAAQLYISPRTVDTHRARACKKLGLRGNHALTKFALVNCHRL